MTDSTPHGLPFMESTDPLSTVADQMEALATAVDGDYGGRQRGSVTTGAHVAGTTLVTPVTFPTPFSASVPIPTVQVTINAGQATHMCMGNAASITRTGFNLITQRSGGTATLTCAWEATSG